MTYIQLKTNVMTVTQVCTLHLKIKQALTRNSAVAV